MFYVLKRNGQKEDIHFDKITYRIAKLINPIELQRLNLPHLELEKESQFLNPIIIAQKTISSIYSGISTEELDIQSAEICVNLATTHPSYSLLGGRILISNLHKKTMSSFVEKIRLLSVSTELIDPLYAEWIFNNAEQLESMIDYDRDYLYDYFGYKTLEKAYLLKVKGKIVERPQDMLMRTAIMVQKHNSDLDMIKRTYDMMSLGYYTHASPTLFNSLSKHRQLSSCFVENTEVMTMNGVKKIQEIQIGDKVVTHTGNFQTVSQLHKNLLGNRKVMNLEVYITKPIKVTDNHRFWTISNDDKVPKWRAVQELTEKHFIAIPSYKGHDAYKEVLVKLHSSRLIEDKELVNILYHTFRMYGIPVQNQSPLILPEWASTATDMMIVDEVNFLRVKRVSETDLTPEYVYTIGVDKDHSYNVEGLICENCFLLGTNDDLTDISTTWNSCAQISKWSGGIGLHVSNIRGKDSLIKGTGGRSNGLVPFLRVFNDIARWIDQGGKRPGSIAIYLEPHHPDIFEFLELRKNFGSETERARDLFLALWISDLFMKQVEADGDWYLLSPDECPRLTDAFGDDYEVLYWQYVNEGKFRNRVKARRLWLAILDSQIETGMPYISYKDAVNKKSNQKNIGTIKSSNLCVSGDTQILTSLGYQHIKALENENVKVWNGIEWSDVTVCKTGTNQNLVRVTLSNGAYLDCTPEHKFYTYEQVEVRAVDLVEGTRMINYDLPVSIEHQLETRKRMLYDCTLQFGHLSNNEFSFVSTEEFLLEIRLILHTFGIESSLRYNNDKYETYSLVVKNSDVNKLENLGIHFKGKITDRENTENIVTVVSVTPSYQNVDTYCFTEPKRHMGMFNGILTGQCNEIVQYSDHNEYAVCNLASIALKSFIVPFENDVTKEWILYSKPNCKYCRYAKGYLTTNNIPFTEIEFSGDSLLKLKQILNTQKVTFPQIFTKKDTEELVHIGGWSDLYKYTGGQFDYKKLYDIAYLATVNLNQVIDVNYYPVPQTRFSNMRHRPIGLGIQGLADALVLMRIPFDSEDALHFNSKMMETIYLASVTASNDLSISRTEGMRILIQEWYEHINQEQYPEFYDESLVLQNQEINELYHRLKPCRYELERESSSDTIGSYSSFDGSPFSEGKFQFDLWGKTEEDLMYPNEWRSLREKVIRYGTRNSLLTALMPTASTSQILGNNECFEFFTNNIYTRKTQAGDFVLVNKYLVKDLIAIGLWDDNMKNLIIANDGSIQKIEAIPPEIRMIYKTMWELKQVWVLKGATARGPFVDQTQSMNIFMGEPDYQRLTSSHFYGWKNGLKTGMYYLRSKPSANAIKFTIDPNLIKQNKEDGIPVETKQEDIEGCLSCSG